MAMETETAEADSLAVAAWVRSGTFEPIVRHYGPKAYRFALYLVGDAEEAKDLSQEAFIRAFVSIRRFDPTRPFYPWFLKILRNLCYSHLRRRRPAVDIDELPQRAQRAQLAERAALSTEERLAVHEALNALSDNDREILVLKAIQGLSYAEIAEVLGIPRGTVMSRLYHARRRLKDILDGRRP